MAKLLLPKIVLHTAIEKGNTQPILEVQHPDGGFVAGDAVVVVSRKVFGRSRDGLVFSQDSPDINFAAIKRIRFRICPPFRKWTFVAPEPIPVEIIVSQSTGHPGIAPSIGTYSEREPVIDDLPAYGLAEIIGIAAIDGDHAREGNGGGVGPE